MQRWEGTRCRGPERGVAPGALRQWLAEQGFQFGEAQAGIVPAFAEKPVEQWRVSGGPILLKAMPSQSSTVSR